MSWQPLGIWAGEKAISSSEPKSPSGVGGRTPVLGVLGVKWGIFSSTAVVGVVGDERSTRLVSMGVGEVSNDCNNGADRR